MVRLAAAAASPASGEADKGIVRQGGVSVQPFVGHAERQLDPGPVISRAPDWKVT